MVVGAVAAPLSYYAMRFRDRRKLDESLDVWACHGIASTWGMIATGLFATVAVNSDGANGLFFGNPGQIGIQILAVIVTMVFSFSMTYVLAKAAEREHRAAGQPSWRRKSGWTSVPTGRDPIRNPSVTGDNRHRRSSILQLGD